MTPLTGMTASQAAEELRQRASMTDSIHNLEINTQPDDPLIEIRRQVHAPLHARIDAALSAEPEAGNG